AHCKNKMQERRARSGELTAILAAQPLSRKVVPLKHRQRQRVHLTHRMAPRAKRFEFRPAEEIENGLTHNAARRITRAQKQNIEDFLLNNVSQRTATAAYNRLGSGGGHGGATSH